MNFIRSTTLALILSGAMILPACQPIQLAEGAISTNDPCSQFRGTIAAARQTEIDKRAQGAAAGAVFGALLGAAVAGSDNRAQGAIAGALAGGLTGFAGVYARQAAARADDNATLLRVIDGDAGREGTLVTRTGQAAASLRTCRRQEIAGVAAAVRGRTLAPDAARTRVRAIQSRVQGDNQIISAAFEGIGRRVTAYVDTADQVASVDNAISIANARRATPAVRRVSAQTQATLRTDVSSRNRVDAELDALEALLG